MVQKHKKTLTHTRESLVKRCLLILDGSETCEDFVMKSCQKCLVQMLTCFEEVIENNLCTVSPQQLYLISLYRLYCFCVCKQDFFPGGHVTSRSRYAKSFALQTGEDRTKGGKLFRPGEKSRSTITKWINKMKEGNQLARQKRLGCWGLKDGENWVWNLGEDKI